jgi:capsular polysaccharide transport system ATP-binding protein
MWGFLNCSRYFPTADGPKVVLNDANLVVGTYEKLGLLVPPTEGKTTIIRLLAGVEKPDSGLVLRDEGGWPLGYGGAFRQEMTGEENVRNVALVAGLEPTAFAAFCADFSGIGPAFYLPMRSYTARMRARLTFATTFGIPARTYLADDKLVGGDPEFRAKCEGALKQRLRTAGLIFVASQPRVTKEYCDRHAVLSRGKIIDCSSHEEAEALFGSTSEKSDGGDMVDETLPSFDLA